jgi:hypothetical protein
MLMTGGLSGAHLVRYWETDQLQRSKGEETRSTENILISTKLSEETRRTY